MKSTPLLMKGPLVRATLAGVKTETRRLVKYIPALGDPEDWCKRIGTPDLVRFIGDYRRFCPYGDPGDRLWVRETWRQELTGHYIYRADTSPMIGDSWQPSIFMPREACRIELELVTVSIQYIQNITDDAIRAEGVEDLTWSDLLEMGVSERKLIRMMTTHPTTAEFKAGTWSDLPPRARWAILWDLIYGADPSTCWAANPPVWVLKYRKVTP